MNKNTKRVLSAITVASLSVTSFTGNIQNVVNAKENKQEENALSINRVNAEVLENEAGAVIRVSASSNVQNVKTTYSVDTAGSKVVSFGDLKAGEVREIQVNFEEDSNKLKSLPKTTAVSDRVDFNKEVRGHKIKGSVSFEYDNGDNSPVVTPTVPTTPTKPGAPVVTTPSNPTAPTNPVVTPTVPTTPTKPGAPVVTPVEPAKPVTPGVEKPEGKKVNLMINRHGIVNGLPSVATFWIYKDVEIGTKVDFDSVKEFLKHYGFGEDYLKKFPAVLDKDYIVDVYLNADGEPIADEPAKPGLVKPLDPNNPVKPSFPAEQVQKVDLKINVHTVENGKPVTMYFRAYGSVDVGTKVDPEYVKDVIGSYGYEIVKIGVLPRVLDKTYTVDADAVAVDVSDPKKDEPKVDDPTKPADTSLEAGMPAKVRWTRAQLKEWGFTFGKITGNYDVDGDLGVFDDEDALDPAYRSGRAHMIGEVRKGNMSFEDFNKNTPHGYSWNSVTKPDGTKGYAMYLYGTDGKFNDGQKAR